MGEGLDTFRQTLDECLAAGDHKIVVNLGEVPMIDSSGVGLLVRYMTSAKQLGGAVKLVNPSRFTTQTLRLVGVLNLFEVFSDETEAVASFRQ
jgi:anti-sigma B factor antagonist